MEVSSWSFEERNLAEESKELKTGEKWEGKEELLEKQVGVVDL